jgi:hypothetical protein
MLLLSAVVLPCPVKVDRAPRQSQSMAAHAALVIVLVLASYGKKLVQEQTKENRWEIFFFAEEKQMGDWTWIKLGRGPGRGERGSGAHWGRRGWS